MTGIPEDVERMVTEREAAREAGDFPTADALRARVRSAGFEIADTPDGPVVTAFIERHAPARPEAAARVGVAPPVDRADEVESVLAEPPTFDASVQWIDQGWPEDVARGIESFRRHQGRRSVQHVVVEATEDAAPDWPDAVEVLRIVPQAGWAQARNAGLRRSGGGVVVLVDGAIEAVGDPIGPLLDALRDPAVGLTGPFGVVTSDLREFHEAPGPEVDAVEGYLMAFRRELLQQGLRFDEKFKFYRTADIEFSFQVKALGLLATVTPVPVVRHPHRMWESTPEAERARLSKRNFYRFLDRWRGRTDLLVSRSSRRNR
jgi:cysteinyl-tRNA synthetase